MLQALPDTALWKRLEKEGRLLSQSADINQATLMNFLPTRPIEEIAQEYIEAFWQLYEPLAFLNRTYRHFLILGEAQRRNLQNRKSAGSPDITWVNLRALFILCWRQGVVRETRWQFWVNLFALLWRYPEVATNYLSVCAQAEHFLEFRELVRSQIELQLVAFKTRQAAMECSPEIAQQSELIPMK